MGGGGYGDAVVAVLLSAGQAAAADSAPPMRKRSPPVGAYGWTGGDAFKLVTALYFQSDADLSSIIFNEMNPRLGY
jgi:hypothetical protein